MRLSFYLLAMLMWAAQAQANDPPTKPIKQSAVKEEMSATASAKEETKPAKESKASKESKAAEAARQKEVQAADELAAKIADRLAAIRKDKEAAAPHPVARPYAPPLRLADVAKPKKQEAHGHEIHWSYEGEGGPMAWGKLNAANTKCDTGTRQSPIDIRDGIRVELDPIQFDYKPVSFSVLDNGHTIQVSPSSGNFLNVSGKLFELVQFHFHRPSEERINGKLFEMVVHLVHKDREGKLAVVAILLDFGEAHPVIQQVWNNLPLEKNEVVKAINNLDLMQLIPKRGDYFTYMGSLTTPPCSEGVLWMVMKEVVHISPEQSAIFARLYPMNARPIQNSAGRVIKESR
ncbi:MAG: carbonic anhydrase family protein [Burkholderiales bacterium]|nr:carbonic anhydrase family protein [Burkholderiales bacterium]